MSQFADDIDRACEYEQMMTQEQIRVASTFTKRKPIVAGLCDHCEGVTPSKEHLFCSESCRDEDAREQRLRAIRGR